MSERSYRSGSGPASVRGGDGSERSRRSGSERAPPEGGGWGAVRESVGVRAIDTRSRPEQALEVAIRMVTARTEEDFQRRELGQRHTAGGGGEMTVEEADAAVLRDPTALAGALTNVDPQGNVHEDEGKIQAMCDEATAYALEQIPEEPGKFTNPAAAFKHAQETAYMRETLKIKVVEAIREKAKDESRQIRRRIRMASERTKPRERKTTGQLLQAAFLTSFDKGSAALGLRVKGEGEQMQSLLAAPDPYDDSCFGVVNRALFQVKNNTRVNGRVLEYLLGYSSVIDPEDLEEIEAGSQGLTVARGKGMRELALKYASHLDKTLPDRHVNVVCDLVRRAADEYSRHERMGTKVEDAYVNRPKEGCAQVVNTNKNAWLRVMFPDAPWPKESDRRGGTVEDRYVAALTRGLDAAAADAADGSNPMDPTNGGFNDGGMARAEKVRLSRSGVAGLPGAVNAGAAHAGRKQTAGLAGGHGARHGDGGHTGVMGIFNPLVTGGNGATTAAPAGMTNQRYGRR